MDIAEAAALLDDRMAAARDEHAIPGIAYGLLLGGSLVHVAGAGELQGHDPATAPMRIASMTKSFTAATVLGLRDQGLLSLDTPIRDILPSAAGIGLPAAGPPLRVAHLLTMTGGFATDDPWGDRQESLPLDEFDALVAAGLTFCRVPGIRFEYANIGYAILGRIITAITGDPYTTLVEDRLLRPLGMGDSAFDRERVTQRIVGHHPVPGGLVEQPEVGPGAFSPMGGLWSTVADLARWMAFLESAWADVPDGGPLDRWSRREMQRAHVAIGLGEDGVAEGYGYGLRVDVEPSTGLVVHHSGGYPGYGSHMRWHPDTRWGVVALANRTYAPVRVACAEALRVIVGDAAQEARRVRSVDRLWPQTRQAMQLAEALLVDWDDASLDARAAGNLDLDQARPERRAAWAALGAGSVRRDPTSVTSRSPAHACWRVDTDGGAVDLEVLMTGEREPRIQLLGARRVTVAPDR